MKKLFTIIMLAFALTAYGQRYVKTFDTLTRALASNLNDVSTNFITLGLTTVGDGGGASYWYDATRSDATNAYGVFTPASGTGRVFRYKDWDNDATSLYTVGDSFTYGAGATSYTNTYVSKFAASMGLPAINLANGSFTISDATWSTFSGWAVTNISGPSYEFPAPAEITENQTWTTLVGFNDLRTGSTSASMYRKGLDHLIHWLAIPATAKKAAQLSDSSTGTWTAIPWSNGMGTIGRYSSSGTLTFNNVMGSDVYVAYIGWATNYGGNIAVSVDGASITNFSTASVAYGNRTYINGSDASIPAHTGPYGNGKIDFCPQIVRVTDLGFGAHTVVVTASVNPVYVLWVAGNGFSRTPRKGPNVFVGSIPRQSPWTASGTDALHASYNSQIQQSVAAARASGLRVALAPVANDYLPSTMQSVDLVHPNNLGHTAIAGAFEKLLIKDLPSVAYGLGTAVATSSGGSGGAGSFSTLSVSGTSTLVGNTTVNSRLLVLPSAVTAPGGYNSRFGYGSTTGSTISMNYGDSTLNRELYLYGDRIFSHVTSTGADAGMFLGLYGQTVGIEGGITTVGVGQFNSNIVVNGTSTLTGAATASSTLAVAGVASLNGGANFNKTLSASSGTDVASTFAYTINQTGTAGSYGLFINPTQTAMGSGLHRPLVIAPGGTNRFYIEQSGRPVVISPNGTSGMLLRGDGATDSQILLSHAATLDRRLTLAGNSVTVTDAAGSTPQTLALGTIGTATAIQGSSTVAQDFAVTGNTTLTGTLAANGAITANAGLTLNRTFTGSSGTESVNSIAYTVNQTGTAASRAINIALTSTAAGSGGQRFISASDDGTDVFYVQTDGRMIINSPNGTSGVLFRGQGSTDSQILIDHAKTLDRRLTLKGNQIYVRDAADSVANTLALGESGATVAIQGNETIAGTTIIGTTGTTTGSVGLKGTTSGTVTVSVAAAAGTHTIKLPTADGTSGQVIQTDAAGQWSWTTPGNPTFVDAAADTTTWIALGTSQTGTVAPATDAGLTFNASNNYITCSGGFLGSGDISLGSGNQFYWQSRALMKSPSDGVLTIYNNAATDFTRLQLGGTTTSFPAFGRSSTTIAVQLADGTAGGKLSVGATQAKVGGTIDQKYTSTGTPASSTETDLHTFTTVASSLGADGDGFTMTSGGTFAGNASATSQLRVYFGGTQIFATGALTAAAAGSWHIECEIIRSSSTTVRCITKFTTANAVTTPLVTQTDLTGLTLSTSNILKVTGQGGGASPASNDIVYKQGRVRYEPAY